MTSDPVIQSQFNKSRLDKFLLIFNLPSVLKSINTNDLSVRSQNLINQNKFEEKRIVMYADALDAYNLMANDQNLDIEKARELAVQYGVNPAIATSRTLQNSLVFDNIRVNNIINSSNQFSNPVWNTAAIPPTVAVTATYTSNQNGLPPFPNPDPLHLSNSFVINASSTYRIE